MMEENIAVLSAHEPSLGVRASIAAGIRSGWQIWWEKTKACIAQILSFLATRGIGMIKGQGAMLFRQHDRELPGLYGHPISKILRFSGEPKCTRRLSTGFAVCQ